jgi:erythromycin esterase-like protein
MGTLPQLPVKAARGHPGGDRGCVSGFRGSNRGKIRDALAEPLLERAIGVIYRPETALLSHYFQAELSRQFDVVEEIPAVSARPDAHPHGPDETYPFGL